MMYDEEQMIKDIRDLFKAQLNAEIDLINTEKNEVVGNPLYIPNIPTTDYIFETIDKTTLNFKEFFVIFGLVDTEPKESNLESFIDRVTLTLQVGTWDKGELERENILWRLLRYRRAILSVCKKNPDMFRGYATPLVSALKPNALPFDRNNVILKCGANITASVTGA